MNGPGCRPALVVLAIVMAVVALPVAARAQDPDPHAGHGTPRPAGGQADAPADGRQPTALPPFVPPVTDAMREAAFPDVHGHASHDSRINGFVLFDRLEWQSVNGQGLLSWSNAGWVGGDINRLWFRTEGHGGNGGMDDARAHVLYGVAFARWWDVVAGVRQDFSPAAKTWLAAGVQGIAPGFFEVEATAYLGSAAQTGAHLSLGYDVLLSNRLVLQPRVAMDLYGKSNEALGVSSGLSAAEGGVRLRYHVTREFAPYVGVSWMRAFGGCDETSRDAAADGSPRLVIGARLWF